MDRPADIRSQLAPLANATSKCAFCPSLCRHACPVATAEARDTTSPWGLMSLVDHLRVGRARVDERVAEQLFHCVGCRACTAFCHLDVPVEATLVEARAAVVRAGRAPYPEARFLHDLLPVEDAVRTGLGEDMRFEPRPPFALLPGRAVLEQAPETVGTLLDLCARLDQPSLACSDAAYLDVGYDLWFAGYHDLFVAQARKVVAALAGARDVVVMSPQDLYVLRDIYPKFGLTIEASLVHTSELLLPLLSGAVVKRIDARVAYHDSCHLARHLRAIELPREVLHRVLSTRLVELPQHGESAVCCGGTGCLPTTHADVAAAMAARVVDQAVDIGVTHMVSFSGECVAMLRAAAGDRLRVEHAVTLVARAVVGELAAG